MSKYPLGMKKKIVLYPHTFIWREGCTGLLFNIDTNAYIFTNLNDPTIASAFNQWEKVDSLYSAIVDTSFLNSFWVDLQKKELGVILDEIEPFFSYPPSLRIKNDIDRLLQNHDSLDDISVLQYVLRIIVAIGGRCNNLPYWKQGVYPIDSQEPLKVERLVGFLNQCDMRELSNIDLVISEWDPTLIYSFSTKLENHKDLVRFFFVNEDVGYKNSILSSLVNDGFPVVQICIPDRTITKANWIEGREYELLVRSEDELSYWETLIGNNTSIKYAIKPIADNNLDFFFKNVFLSEEEILSQKLTKKDIFRHQALNVNQFGSLYIYPDGTIHPAADAPAIGTLEDSVHQTIIRELEENHAWRQTRRLMEPCNNCIFHDLCPSPSVYERIFGVPGCTYWKE